MNINPINSEYNYSPSSFKHGGGFLKDKTTSSKDKKVIAGSVFTGTAIAAALMAKHAGYSLKPSKIFGNSIKPSKIYEKIKNSYLAKVDFEAPQVIALGAGSCIGGLAGGYLTDKNPVNRKAKRREAVMQFGNISIPILTVAATHSFTKKFGKITNSIASLGAVFVGVYMANYLMNKLGNALFHNKSEARKVKPTDFSAHLDDFVLAASYIFPRETIASTKRFTKLMGDVVHGIGRLVPIALMVPGYEIGIKKSKYSE